MPWLAYVANFRELLWDTVIPSCGGGFGIYLIELRLSIRGLSRTGRLFARRRHQTPRHCVWGAVVKRSISADLNWKSLSVQPLTSELPLLSTLWGERDTVWWSLIWRAYCSYSHKSLILPETLSFKCSFHLALHENNCACCHKIKNTYGLQQKVCHSALPTRYQQLNVFLYQICFVWKTNWGNLHLFFSLCDSNKNK